MNFKIEDLSNTENALIKNAQQEYGIIYDNANNAVSLMWDFIKVVKSDGWIFISFLSQVQKFLTLALLSTVRMHDVQTNMLLRQALESAVLAGYSLTNSDLESFGYIDSNGITHENKNAKENAYKWIQNSYPIHSKKIRSFKDAINSISAHSNIINTTSNFEFNEGEMNVMFFDKPHVIITKQRLWWIANISFGVLDLFVRVVQDFPLIKFVETLPNDMKKLGVENEQVKQELTKNEAFAKWLTKETQ